MFAETFYIILGLMALGLMGKFCVFVQTGVIPEIWCIMAIYLVFGVCVYKQ